MRSGTLLAQFGCRRKIGTAGCRYLFPSGNLGWQLYFIVTVFIIEKAEGLRLGCLRICRAKIFLSLELLISYCMIFLKYVFSLIRLYLALILAGHIAFICAIAEPSVIKLTPPAGVDRADIYFEASLTAKNGILVLCPGMNGDGKLAVSEPAWRKFALENGLGLVGLTFSSPASSLYARPGVGYYYPEQGSGASLLKGLETIYGRDLKIFLYGYSGGAQFGSRFVDQNSSIIAGWAAYSASFWSDPVSPGNQSAPGIVACGEFDADRYGPSFAYFQQGRRKDSRWTWVSLAGTGHVRHQRFEEFIRTYFSALLLRGMQDAVWFDAETKLPITEGERLLSPTLSVWLPSPAVAKDWHSLHHP